MTAGPIIASVGFLLMQRISPTHSNYFLYVLPAALVFGCGLVLTVAPLTNTVMASVARSHSGIASAVNNAISRLAGLLIVAFLGILVANQTASSLHLTADHLSSHSKSVVRQAIAGGLKPSILATVPADERQVVTEAVTTTQRASFVQSMQLNAVLAFAAGIISFLMIQNVPPKKEQT
jgi:hypothetical protein